MLGNIIFVVWRESIEALLVIGILYTWLRHQQVQSGAGSSAMFHLWVGIAGGVLLAFALALVMLGVQSELAEESLDYFKIAIVLLAAALITQMVFWMRKRGRTLKRDLENTLQQTYQRGSSWGIALLATIAIGREGAETVIFLYGMGLASLEGGVWSLYAGATVGFVLAFATFYLLNQGSRWLSWQNFFRISETILLLLASALLVDGVDKLIGLGILPALIDPIWDTSQWLDDSTTAGGLLASLTGYRARPALLVALVYVAYWALVFSLLRLFARPSLKPPVTAMQSS